MISLDELNSLSSGQARTVFLDFCGSRAWADQMVYARPFHRFDEISEKADLIWNSLKEEDWLEAFTCHPKIGSTKAQSSTSNQSEDWSTQEQSGVSGAPRNVLDDLMVWNEKYVDKFGHVFLICATGKSAEEMLSQLESRYQNTFEQELKNSAEEQRKITQIRLAKGISKALESHPL